MTHESNPRDPDSSYTQAAPDEFPGLFIGGVSSIFYLPHDRGMMDTMVICAKEMARCVDPKTPFFREVLYYGFKDELLVPEELVEQAAEAVVSRIRANKTVLVVCAEGRNRSGIVVARALLELGDPNPIQTLRRRRGLHVLTNKIFAGWIRNKVGFDREKQG